jgi:aryl-alcohol dehydrogenase-like predicted oxidoreductase
MERRLLGRRGPPVPVVLICPADEAVARRVRALGGETALPAPAASVRYNLLDQKDANLEIPRLVREGAGVVAVHVLAGGALGASSLEPRFAPFLPLAKAGRTLVQAAIQFVLANESVSCARIRVSHPDHVEEVLRAPEAPPLTGQDLELIFETWANRFG